MSGFMFQDESIDIEEKQEEKIEKKHHKYWRILIIDDDESVHQVTRLVLLGAKIEGRELEIVSVYSAQQAKEALMADSDFCMAFVDVVMETDHAGLELVQWIRKELKNQAIRLILRTGQAGSAPENKVIKDFDINDYKEKTDFTSNKMITTVYAAVRGYRDIITIQRSLDAFKQLIKSTHALLKIDQFKAFGSAALNHLLTLMKVDNSALYIVRSEQDFEQKNVDMIIACTGKYTSEFDSLLASDVDDSVQLKINKAFEDKAHYIGDDCFVGYYETSSNASSVLYIEFEDDAEHFKSNLAEMFATNVVLILESLAQKKEVSRTQKELMYITGEAIEANSKETGAHVKRVELICELLAKKLDLSPLFIETLRASAALHDIGKVTIPESILHKPGKLSNEEWQQMKMHADAGGALLDRAKSNVARMGANVARYHHENWNGSGYPKGLKGEDIPLEARIMAIADVFDALGSRRCYKEPWLVEDIKSFIIEEKGRKFEPKLVDIFIENFDEFVAFRTMHPDD
jgi:response regulator RpfG family c-di-GMP phosphodiesterase